jgi:hypothetical protein
VKCPHCHEAFHAALTSVELGHVGSTEKWRFFWRVQHVACPACAMPILFAGYLQDWGSTRFPGKGFMVFPRGAPRPKAPPAVHPDIAADFDEACLVFDDSPQASAALSRRCLQHLLAERGVSNKKDLSAAIDDALASRLPSHIADDLDAIRNIGNFAAHPQKSANSGEVLPVEPHEAEWNLDVLEQLFDFYYVQPAKSKAKRDALNEKLAEAGKRAMKTPPDPA